MRYPPRHSAPRTGDELTLMATFSPRRLVNFWRDQRDVPGPGALPMKTTPGPGHQLDLETVKARMWSEATDEQRAAWGRVAEYHDHATRLP